LKNGNFIDGEIKSMEHNLLNIDTDYGDKDFIIEWEEIREIHTGDYYYIYTADGTIYYGWLRSSSDTTINIISRDGTLNTCKQLDIIRLMEINEGFKNRINGGFDIGLGLAKANNFRKLTGSANIGYKAEKWYGKAYASTLFSSQDKAEQIRRSEGGMDLRYRFYKDWALDPSMHFLTNTEQKLLLRSSLKLGIGKYLIHRYYGYWGIGAGLNRNIERFSNETPDRNSWEGYFGTEVDLYDIKDLDLFLRSIAYPSFTESGRWRADLNFNIKYKLPLDFYIKVEFTLNYDNKPAEEASNTDYVLQIGFGWSW
jgi:hypothetical protein